MPRRIRAEQRYTTMLYLTSALNGVGGQRQAPAALPAEERRSTHCHMRLGALQCRCELVRKISTPTGIRSSIYPASRPTELSRSGERKYVNLRYDMIRFCRQLWMFRKQLLPPLSRQRWCHETFVPCSSMSSLRTKRLGNRGLIPGRDFFTQSKSHPPLPIQDVYAVATGDPSPGSKVQQCVNLGSHPHLVTRLRMRGAIPTLTVHGGSAGNMLLTRTLSYEKRFYIFF